jgi:hypothetical protein
MKFTLFFVLFFVCLLKANAQQDQLLPVDEHGKFIYYEVVEAKQISRDSLKISVLDFLHKKNPNLKYKSTKGDTAFIATGKLIISKTLLVMSHPSGEVLFNFQTEVRAGKYRFWLSDFNFIPYQRDRYGNFVANTTTGIPLESGPGKLNVAQWKEYQVQTAAYAKDFAAKFKVAMAYKADNAAPAEKKVVRKDW